MSDTVLGLVSTYGAPALFLALVAGAVGIPLPGTLLLLGAGSLVSSEDLDLWQVLIFGTCGAVLGDQLGYVLGRIGGVRIMHWLTRLTHGEDRVDRAQASVVRWGGGTIFITRWLVGPLGPWVNLSAGSLAYPWVRFLFWGILGEMVWVAMYVSLGRLFADRIEVLADLVGSVGWALASLAVAGLLAYLLYQYIRDLLHERNGGGQPPEVPSRR
ncbi:MAG: VTT domain-containing protein [Dehalococcoidia bacterium]|nr:VTT domain-containing protein [Dehalococcoidia bacterium]